MKSKRFVDCTTILCLVLIGMMAGCTNSVALTKKPLEMAPRISKEQLQVQLDDPSLLILDVRTASHWKRSETKIKGAIRENPEDVVSWFSRYIKSKIIVFYCA